jgi:hypothetical protein
MTCLGLLVLALTARPAMADNCVAPPGTSGIDQYCESLPSPGGSSHQGPKGGGGSHLPSGTKKALAKQGAAGAGVLALTKQSPVQVPTSQSGSSTPSSTAQHSTTKQKHSSTSNKSAQSQPAATQNPVTTTPAKIPAAPASNPVSAVGKSVSDNGGLLLGLLIAAGVLGLLSWAARRGRSGPESA